MTQKWIEYDEVFFDLGKVTHFDTLIDHIEDGTDLFHVTAMFNVNEIYDIHESANVGMNRQVSITLEKFESKEESIQFVKEILSGKYNFKPITDITDDEKYSQLSELKCMVSPTNKIEYEELDNYMVIYDESYNKEGEILLNDTAMLVKIPKKLADEADFCQLIVYKGNNSIDDGQWVCSEYITSKAVLAKSVTSKRDLNKLVEESVLHLARVGSKRTYEAIMMFVNQRGPINDSHTSNIFKTL